MDLGIKNKVAVVLAASKGLGRACASALAAEGAYVVIGARNRQQLEHTAQQIRQESGSIVLAVPTDVTRAEEIKTLIETTVQAFGHIDILVTNAGSPPAGTFETCDDAHWQAAFELNLLSTVRTIREALPHMRKTGRGRIINIVSTSVKQPIDALILSNAIRPAVVGLAKTLSLEFAPDQITVNNVCPGRILTDRILQGTSMRRMMEQGMSQQEALGAVAKDIPLGRIGRPEELGALVAFLASQQASYITGATIQVDGGLLRTVW